MTDNKYSKGKIYEIVCNVTGEKYYGSTCEKTLARRLANHVGCFKNWKKTGKGSCMTSFQILERGNYKIYLVELYPCGSIDELHQREGFYQRNNVCVNKNMAGRTSKQFYQDNKIKIGEEVKIYRENNLIKIAEQRQQYYEANKPQFSENHKQYYEEHKNQIIEKSRLYYATNKDKINERRRKKALDKKEILLSKDII